LHNLALCGAETRAGARTLEKSTRSGASAAGDWSKAATTGVLEPGRRQQNVFIPASQPATE